MSFAYFMWAVLLVTLAVVSGIAIRAFIRYRGTRVIVCPETGKSAAVEVDSGHAATSAVTGDIELRLKDCSRWPKRRLCDQACLGQIEAAPEGCLLRNLLSDWYVGKKCHFCHQEFLEVHWHDHRPALLARGTLKEWSTIPPESVPTELQSSAPVCWNCFIAEKFRRERPDLVTDRDWDRGEMGQLLPSDSREKREPLS